MEAAAPPGSFEARRSAEDELLGQVIAVWRQYHATAVTDQYAARAVVGRLSGAGIVVRVQTMTAQTKTAAFSELRAHLYDGTGELRDEPELLAELRRLRSRFSAGSAAVINPRVGGSHGDRAQALALAVFEHARIGGGTDEAIRVAGGTIMGGVLEALF